MRQSALRANSGVPWMPSAPASARSATQAWRSAVPLAGHGTRPASRTVSATSRTSSLRRRPCSITRWKKYAAGFSQSMPGKVSTSDAGHRIFDAVAARGGELRITRQCGMRGHQLHAVRNGVLTKRAGCTTFELHVERADAHALRTPCARLAHALRTQAFGQDAADLAVADEANVPCAGVG